MRRRVSLLALWVVLAGAAERARADEPSLEAHAFVTIETERPQVVVGEVFTLTLRVGIDRTFFDEHAVELFRRRMDLPVQIEAPWLERFEGTRVLAFEPPRDPVRLAIGGRELLGERVADEVRGERTFEVVVLSRRYLAEAVDAHDLAATLRFGYATRFEEDFLGGRVAVDRRDVLVRASPHRLEVVELPTAGRLEAFDGAVGRFAVSAALASKASGATGALALTLVIRGDGNLAFVDPPPPERLAGFHVYGLVDDHGAPVRTVVYEIAPRPGTTAVPSIPFAYYDPAPPGGYHVVHTDPLPLAEPPPAADPGDEPPPRSAFPWGPVLGLAALALALGIVATRRRRRAADRRGPTKRAHGSARLEEEGAEATDVLIEALAAHLQVTPAAVVGPDLADRLVDAGVDPVLASHAAKTTEALVGARFRREASTPVDRTEVAALLDALDAAFRDEPVD